MLLKVGSLTFGWGAEVRDLPENKDAYGPRVLSHEEEIALAVALGKAGWLPSWRVKPRERVVFLCEPGKWRQTITSKSSPGQTLEVLEEPKKAAVSSIGSTVGGTATVTHAPAAHVPAAPARKAVPVVTGAPPQPRSLNGGN